MERGRNPDDGNTSSQLGQSLGVATVGHLVRLLSYGALLVWPDELVASG
jgi:hypothetical protein